MKTLSRILAICLLSCVSQNVAGMQFDGNYDTEWQWNANDKLNWVNLLRFDVNVPLWKGGAFQAATIHIAKTGEHIIDDYQGFSNIEENNLFAAIAQLGYEHTFKNVVLFCGIGNVNEDFFISDVTSFFKNSSCGIFPTIAANYPIANYPLSGLCVSVDANLNNWHLRSSIYNGSGYNGWKRGDNPFVVRLNRDGIFNMTELSYQSSDIRYFAGVAIHNRRYSTDESGELQLSEDKKRVNCAVYAYGEQKVWENSGNKIDVLFQYSENTDKRNSCIRYAGLGAVYDDRKNGSAGISVQYAKYVFDWEISGELTYSRQLTDNLSLKPSLQFVDNCNGFSTVLNLRLSYSFSIL